MANGSSVSSNLGLKSGHKVFSTKITPINAAEAVIDVFFDETLSTLPSWQINPNAAAGVPNSIRNHLTQPLVVPQTVHVVQLLESFKKTGKHLALVSDEFGSVQGLVTLIDVMEAIVGDLSEPGDRVLPEAIQRDDGSWLIDGSLSVVELRRRFKLPSLPGESDEDYETLGGFMMDRFGHIPRAGEHFTCHGWRFEVADMDRHRVDKVLLTKVAPKAPGPSPIVS